MREHIIQLGQVQNRRKKTETNAFTTKSGTSNYINNVSDHERASERVVLRSSVAAAALEAGFWPH